MSDKIFTVTITAGAPIGVNGGGFIDNKKVEQYGLIGGLTFAECKDKKRANIRWANIIDAVTMDANCTVTNIVKVGGTVDGAPTSIKFDLYYQQSGQPSTWSLGDVIVDIPAVVNLVANGMIFDLSGQTEVFDPTQTLPITDKFAPGGTIASHLAVGARLESLITGKLAASLAAATAMIVVTAV